MFEWPKTKMGWFLTLSVPGSLLSISIGILVWFWPLSVAGFIWFLVYAALDKPYKTDFDKEGTLEVYKDRIPRGSSDDRN